MEKFIPIIQLIFDNLTIIIIAAGAYTFLSSAQFRESILKFFRLFLYREAGSEFALTSKELSNVEKKIKALEKDLTNSVLKDKTEVIQKELDTYIDNNLKELIQNKINDPDTIKENVLSNLKEDVKGQVESYLKKISINDIQDSVTSAQEAKNKQNNNESLSRALEREASSASMLKTVMINLFVVATIAFLLFNIIIRPDLTTNSYIATVALYFSLGAFMLYIIRTSHFRTSVLLAIKEDERNYYNFEEYMTKHKQNSDLNEHDVDVIRMIMTNRAEREQKADHPYEVILKGVSGSNIQFKGGKIALGGNSKSNIEKP